MQVFALCAGIMACALFYLCVRKSKFYPFALLFLTASWAMAEYNLWLSGTDMFGLLLAPAVPLDFFFAVWIAFAIWLGEQLGQRKFWIVWVVALGAIFCISRVCMNCI